MAINKSYWQCKKNIPISPKEKIDLLKYEVVDTFRSICRSFCNWGNLSQFDKNLLLESLAIHTRILVDFFYPKRRFLNDIAAENFVKNWDDIRPELTQILYDAREKAHKQLAHLSTWRVKLKKDRRKPWDNKGIQQDMEEVIKVFESTTNIKF